MTSESGSKRRTRNDPRREQTRIAIIEKAEELFALHGIEGVSLRQIGTAIGSGNTSVVAYHFGSKEALLEAIFHHRLVSIEERRKQLLLELDENGGRDDLYNLVVALWLPLFEQLSADGRHSYANFVGALMRSEWAEYRVAVNPDYPVTNQLIQDIGACLPESIHSLFEQRINISAVIITGALALIDRVCESGELTGERAQSMFDDALQMTFSALLAPPAR